MTHFRCATLGPHRQHMLLGGDVFAASWWQEHDGFPIGRGDSPDHAYADLRAGLRPPLPPSSTLRPASSAARCGPGTHLAIWPDHDREPHVARRRNRPPPSWVTLHNANGLAAGITADADPQLPSPGPILISDRLRTAIGGPASLRLGRALSLLVTSCRPPARRWASAGAGRRRHASSGL